MGDKKRPVRILVLGGDVGFFNDEVRHNYGNKVEVFGTTIETAYSRKRKRAIIEWLKTKSEFKEPETKDYLLKALQKDIHPNDRKWRSIVEMRDFPEFDMIIDTYGELKYSSAGKDIYDQGERLFDLTMKAALLKLLPGGDLYISDLDKILEERNFNKFVGEKADEFTITKRREGEDTHIAGPRLSLVIHRKEKE